MGAFVRKDHDTLVKMAAALKDIGKEVLLTNEDWLGGKAPTERINGGMLFVKNTPWTRALFEDLLEAHQLGSKKLENPRTGLNAFSCGNNEQICLNSLQFKKV